MGDDKPYIYPIVKSHVFEGAHFDYKLERLKSDSDSQQEGLRLNIGGGKYEDKKQNAIIEFICKPPDESGSEDGAESRRRRRDDENKDEGEDKGDGDKGDGDKGDNHDDWAALKKVQDGKDGTLEFKDYDENTLRLEWRTPYGCEDAVNTRPPLAAAGGSFRGFSSFSSSAFWDTLRSRCGSITADMAPMAGTWYPIWISSGICRTSWGIGGGKSSVRLPEEDQEEDTARCKGL